MTSALLVLLLCAAPTLTLDQALAQARAHPRLAQARAAATFARARVAEARAGYLPSASVGLAAWRSTANPAPRPGETLPPDPLPPGGPSHSFYAATAGVSQPLWDFGRTRGQVCAAQAGVRAAESDAQVVAADVELAVRISFYDALAAAELLHIADETVANLEAHLAAATRLVEVGKRPPFDVTRARIDVATARSARLTAAGALVEARATLAAAMGLPALPEVTLSSPPPAVTRDPGLDDLVTHRLRRRPELVALDARVAGQQAQLAAQRSSHWPILSATGQVAVRGLERTGWQRGDNWQLGVQLVAPLLAGGADQARIEQQAAALDGLRAARRDLELQVRVEASKLVEAVATARARAEAARAIVGQARESLTIAEGRYAAGVANLIELADAQRTFTAAEAEAARAGYDLAIARARLHRAAGDP
jgi:outer membrane protein